MECVHYIRNEGIDEGKFSYDSYYDSYYCIVCDTWLNKACGHSYPDCHSHCDERPERPSDGEVMLLHLKKE